MLRGIAVVGTSSCQPGMAETSPSKASAQDRPGKANKNLIGKQIIRSTRNSFKTKERRPF